ncbi:hypothetical protein B0H21DRAFT_758126 [Amylocystis lapponica]|nr:hypothetical protein B0H21DRAFT_758126 [Amylocystis lapponica]
MSPKSALYKGINYQNETVDLLRLHKDDIPLEQHRDIHEKHDRLTKIAEMYIAMSSLRAIASYKGIRDFRDAAQLLNGRTKLSSVGPRSESLWAVTGGRPQRTLASPVLSTIPDSPVPADDISDASSRNTDISRNAALGGPILSDGESSSSGAPLVRRRTYHGDVRHEDNVT